MRRQEDRVNLFDDDVHVISYDDDHAHSTLVRVDMALRAFDLEIVECMTTCGKDVFRVEPREDAEPKKCGCGPGKPCAASWE